MTALGSLALSQHRFGQALQIGRRARTLAPSSAPPYGVVGDALLELGRYDEAFAAFDAMARTRPSAASYARVAYARELHRALDAAAALLAWRSTQASGSNGGDRVGGDADRQARARARPVRGGGRARARRVADHARATRHALDALAQVEVGTRQPLAVRSPSSGGP